VGYIVSPAGLSMDPAKIQASEDWPIPQTIKEVQSFLGFANFYRRFIQNFASISKPLTTLTKKTVDFAWFSACQSVFEFLKTQFNSLTILAHFHPDRATVIKTDASDYAIATVLSQIDPVDNLLHPIAFYSRSMTLAELNYDIYNKELLAIFIAFKQFCPYLEGLPDTIDIITDHKNLEYFATMKLLTRRQARWSEYLSGFDFTVRYRPG
jgi:RNase H-like domain found in reverse transcriptase